MKKNLLFAAFLVLVSCTSQEAKAVTFDPTVRYSREVINARMTNWKNKDNSVGFPNANSTNGSTTPGTAASWDYVPGVVAKGILDVWAYYQDSTWADAWYEGLCSWGLTKTAKSTGGSLDDLNCTKVFFGLYDGAKSGGKFENSSNATYFKTQMENGATGLKAHKDNYSITSGGAAGGWSHKAESDHSKSYYGQMWCDGAYMGPALLAQLITYDALGSTGLGWSDVVTQFTASWPYLWDSSQNLPYHVIFTDVSTNKNAKAIYNAGHAYACSGDASIYHSEEYWGRAAGWYIVALVDVLEAMEQDGQKSTPEFATLNGYLTALAVGLVARQDATTGCWYQLLKYDDSECASGAGSDASITGSTSTSNGDNQCNYLESSASCLITAALLKGLRLGYLNETESGRNIKTAAKNGYEGIINNFLTGSAGSYQLANSCQSAGLGTDRYGTAAYYLIGKDVKKQSNSEGKVLGAFLMAAVEYERAYMPAAGGGCQCLRITTSD